MEYVVGGGMLVSEEIGHTLINVHSHVPFIALNNIPHCLQACNLLAERLNSTDQG